MKSRLQLSATLLRELSGQYSVEPSRDLRRLRESVKHKGEAFLTMLLPDFCQSFERSLDRGFIAPGDFAGFRRQNRLGPPRFLGGFLAKVFDEVGKLRTQVDPGVVHAVRQFCLVHKKSFAIASEKRQAKAIRGYLNAEAEITEELAGDPDHRFRRVAAIVVADILSVWPQGWIESLVGKHGPGATAEGYTSNGRWNFGTWHDRLESVFPYSRHAVSDDSLMLEEEIQRRVVFRPENEEQPVKVVFVPKTMKTPRVIAIEPSCMQFAQQALLQVLAPRIESGARLTSGRINFSDQSANQRLAKASSKNGKLATIDMKEASDRVSYAHASALFAVAPKLWEFIDGCRSRAAKLPDGSVVPLKKFASMGSALCFPVEALAFFVAIVSSRLRSRGLSATRGSVYKYSRDVYVYGDDIVIPTDEAERICADLEAYGFRVNSHKSFWTGRFRESCGVDAYDGEEVTPTYCRFAPPDTTLDSEALISWVAMANGFYTAGLWRTAEAVKDHVERILGKLPVSNCEIGGLYWLTFSKSVTTGRWNKDLHRRDVRTWVPKPVRRVDLLDSYGALTRWHVTSALADRTEKAPHKGQPRVSGVKLKKFELPDYLNPLSVGFDHLAESVMRHAIVLKRGWVSSTGKPVSSLDF